MVGDLIEVTFRGLGYLCLSWVSFKYNCATADVPVGGMVTPARDSQIS